MLLEVIDDFEDFDILKENDFLAGAADNRFEFYRMFSTKLATS